MRRTITALLLAFAFAGEAEEDKEEPAKENTRPGCGNTASINTAIGIIRDEYFSSNKERKLELVSIRTTGRDAELGNYSCAASVRFDATNNDIIFRKGIMDTGTIDVPVKFEIYADAVDPDKSIVSVKRIRDLELDL